MRTIFLFHLCFFIYLSGFAQISDDFSDGNITNNPAWAGDIEKFAVNTDFILQLNDVDKGEANIFTENTFTQDLEWYVDVNLKFAPSSSNYAKIFLAAKDSNKSTDGYYLKLGASGSDDAIELHEVSNGNDTKIGEGTLGKVSNKPNLGIKATYVDGLLEVYTDYYKTGFYTPTPEISVSIDEMNTQYFGLGGKYTKSNSNKFFFDNVLIQEYTPDTEGPKLTDTKILSNKSIVLIFDEAITNVTKEQFNIQETNITNAYIKEYAPNEVIIEVDQPFSAKGSTFINIINVQDLAGNISTDIESEFLFLKFPDKGTVIINEILTDPENGGYDFIELYNKSDYNVTLQGCTISNNLNGKSETLGDIRLKAKSYVAFTENPDDLYERYEAPETAVIIKQDIPALNNGEANITITNALNDTLDTFDYKEDLHLPILDNTEGVSLERISALNPTNESSNWTSAAASTLYATPGYENSALVQPVDSDESFSLITESFSPNQDGSDDVMALQYNLDKPGYVHTLNIYDSNGYHIKTIHNNELLATQGIITWNGQDKTGRVAEIGIYILVGKAYHNDGDVKHFRKAVSLLDFIK